MSIAVERELVDFGVSSEAVYFGIGIATKALIGLAVASTILVGKPFALWAVDRIAVLPDTMRSDPLFVATLRNVTWVIAFYEMGSAVWDIWLYNNSGVNLFLVGRQVANLAVSFVLIFATFIYLDRRLSQLPDWPGLPELLSSSMDRTAQQPSDEALQDSEITAVGDEPGSEPDDRGQAESSEQPI